MDGNIIGEGFSPMLRKQIDVRQKLHGSGYDGSFRTFEELTVLTNNTAWCKLVSSTVASGGGTNSSTIDFLIKKLGLTGDKLAEQFILFNGTAHSNHILTLSGSLAEENLRSGIDYSKNALGNDRVYGIGGTAFGLNPMPGIENIKVQHKNRGSIRTANVKLKAYNKEQFEIIDALYLRVGFTVLLEWGNSMYLDNNGDIQRDPKNSLAYEFLQNSNYSVILSAIEKRKNQSYGNYDAMFGTVTNFHWSFLRDGSYDITLDLISYGDVIESFKLNVSHNAPTPPSVSTTTNPKIDNARTSNRVGEIIYDISNNLQYEGTPRAGQIVSYLDGDPNKPIRDSFTVQAAESGLPTDQVFIRLGTFLEQMEEKIFYKLNNDRILKFDTSVSKNLMGVVKVDNDNVVGGKLYPNHVVLHQVSYDPFVCLVYTQFTANGIFNATTYLDNRYTSDTGLALATPDSIFEVKIGDKYYGRIMNIYLNADFLIDQLESVKDSSNTKVVLFDYLRAVLKGVNAALGGVNDLDIIIDETTNTAKIIDKNPYPNGEKVLENFGLETKTATFELYGYEKKGDEYYSTFIKDFSFTTELSPEFSTMITVGASSNAKVVGEEYTALSLLNKGLYDRYKKQVTQTPPSLPPVVASGTYTIEEYNFLKAAYDLDSTSGTYLYWPNNSYRTNAYPVNFLSFLDSLYGTGLSNRIFWNKEWCNNFKTVVPSILRYWYRANNESFPLSGGTGFIPFNLSLTMDGISGMKIYQKFRVNSKFMPSNYPDNLEFLIRNIVHEVKNNKWTTTLESFCTSVPGSTGAKRQNTTLTSSSSSTTSRTRTRGRLPYSMTPQTHTDDPSLSKLRNTMVRIAKSLIGQEEITAVMGPGYDWKGVWRANTNLKDNQGFKDSSFQQRISNGGGWRSSIRSAWCNYFVNMVWQEAYTEVGISDSNIKNIHQNRLRGDVKKALSANVFTSLNNAVAASPSFGFRAGTFTISDLSPGDLIVYDWGHINMVISVKPATNEIITIGGNESEANPFDNNGGAVTISTRKFQKITGYIKVIE